jgi:hypothetical protein
MATKKKKTNVMKAEMPMIMYKPLPLKHQERKPYKGTSGTRKTNTGRKTGGGF